MRRYAAHHIYWRRLYPLSYIELDETGGFRGVFPLGDEIHSTAFMDGLLIPVRSAEELDGLDAGGDVIKQLSEEGITEDIALGDRVCICRVHNGAIVPVRI